MNPSTDENSGPLRIMQYNVAKTLHVMDSILNDDKTKDYDILLLQEPCRNYNQTTPLLHPAWTAIEPTHLTDNPPRAAIYLNRNKRLTSTVEQIPIPHEDILAISIPSKRPFEQPTLIVNLYNDSATHTTTDQLHRILLRHLEIEKYDVVIVAGDFNLHHALWNPVGYTAQDAAAETLVETMMETNLRPLLPPGTITHPARHPAESDTAIDLVWGNENAEGILIKCHTVELNNDHTSDHLPIEIVLDVCPKILPPTIPPYDYNKTNWELIKIELECLLPPLIDPNNTTPQELDDYADALVSAYQKAVAKQTPRKRTCPHSKRWWNNKLSAMRREANHSRNRFWRSQDEIDREEWKEMRTRYKREIKAAKRKTWQKFVEEADERTIWTVKKYIDNPPSPYYIPTINNATSNERKAAEFACTFFPQPPPAPTDDIDGASYPLPVPSNSNITMKQVRRAIDKISAKKAPGPDEIANITLKKTFATASHHLHALVQGSINTSHFPTAFKTTTTVVIRKPGKPDYTKANAYRPIALENTLGKLIESVITELLSHAVEEHQLIPPQHYGGRPGRTGEEAMVMLMERIMHAWKEGAKYSVIFMDVAGAFNYVLHKRLIHDMRKRRVPEFIVRWVENFLQNRSTRLKFNGVESERICTNAGVPQGSPISPILYMFYNADLLEIPGVRSGLLSLGFIDDIAFGIQGETEEGNARELERMLMEAEGWRQKHGARFEESKYVLVHFTKAHSPNITDEAHVRIGDTTILPAGEAKYLGVFFDRKLSFQHHIQYAAKKGTQFALAISRIANCTRGPAYQQTRTLFTSVAAPRMDHAAIVWYRPFQGVTPPARQPSVAKLESAQRMAMKAILGTFRTTATTALQIDTSLLPTHLRLRNRALQSWTRMQTAPATHPINAAIQRATSSRSTSPVTTPLEHLARTFPNHSTPIETIEPFPVPPWWQPPFATKIEMDKKSAKTVHNDTAHDDTTLCIYTDGSVIDGHVGAAAVCPQIKEVLQRYLGSDKEHNVYTAEITALELAAEIAILSPPSYTKCVIYVDSQAAIKGINKPSKQSGQMILTSAIAKIQALADGRRMVIEIIWVPGHEGVEGNEMADEAAKEAAKSEGNDANIRRSMHKPLKSARSQCIKQEITGEWNESCQSQALNRDAKQLLRITKKPNALRGNKLYNTVSLTRRQTAQLARLRSGHCSLNQYLHRFGHAESPKCECGSDAIENVEHFLLHCPRYDRQRALLVKKVGVGGMRVEKLLGRPRMIRHTLNYVDETRRFTF
jgi:ribonuclease HI/endonuclease/exonuclease/phosphatase family metal-dependent hydrolase